MTRPAFNWYEASTALATYLFRASAKQNLKGILPVIREVMQSHELDHRFGGDVMSVDIARIEDMLTRQAYRKIVEVEPDGRFRVENAPPSVENFRLYNLGCG